MRLLLVHIWLQDPIPEVRQSSFALLGDLTKACFQHVQPHVGMLLFLCVQGLSSYIVHISVAILLRAFNNCGIAFTI